MNIEKLQAIETELLQLIAATSHQLPQHDVDELESLVKAGEPGIALENLCTQLHEYGAKLSAQTLDRILSVGESMGLNLSRWKPRLLDSN